MLLSDWLLCVGGVAWGTVVGHVWVGMDVGVAVGVGVGVRLGVRLGVGMGISLLGLTWNRPTVTIDFFSVDKVTKFFFLHGKTAKQSKNSFLHFLNKM